MHLPQVPQGYEERSLAILALGADQNPEVPLCEAFGDDCNHLHDEKRTAYTRGQFDGIPSMVAYFPRLHLC